MINNREYHGNHHSNNNSIILSLILRTFTPHKMSKKKQKPNKLLIDQWLEGLLCANICAENFS